MIDSFHFEIEYIPHLPTSLHSVMQNMKSLVIESRKMTIKFLFYLVMFCVIFIRNTYAEKIEECDCPSKIAEKCSDNCCGLMGNVCCTEKEYYEQFPSLEDSKVNYQTSIQMSLFKTIRKLMVGAVSQDSLSLESFGLCPERSLDHYG